MNINKDIILVIISYLTNYDDIKAMISLIGDLVELDYKLLCIMKYPKFTEYLSNIFDDISKLNHISWEEIFFSYIDENENCGKVLYLRYYHFRFRFHFKLGGLLQKLYYQVLNYIHYPYLYSQIKDIYNLKNILLEDFGGFIYSNDPGNISEYLRTGKTESVKYVSHKEFTGSDTILAMLFKDGFVPDALYDLSELLYTCYRLIKRTNCKYSTFYDFLLYCNISKDLLKELLSQNLMKEKCIKDMQKYISS